MPFELNIQLGHGDSLNQGHVYYFVCIHSLDRFGKGYPGPLAQSVGIESTIFCVLGEDGY